MPEDDVDLSFADFADPGRPNTALVDSVTVADFAKSAEIVARPERLADRVSPGLLRLVPGSGG